MAKSLLTIQTKKLSRNNSFLLFLLRFCWVVIVEVNVKLFYALLCSFTNSLSTTYVRNQTMDKSLDYIYFPMERQQTSHFRCFLLSLAVVHLPIEHILKFIFDYTNTFVLKEIKWKKSGFFADVDVDAKWPLPDFQQRARFMMITAIS